MDINRNQFFMVGVIVLLLGIQFRAVDTFVFNDKFTKFVAERLPSTSNAEASALSFYPSGAPMVGKTFKPPQWLGWSLLSVGSVLILHSLAMKKPGG